MNRSVNRRKRSPRTSKVSKKDVLTSSNKRLKKGRDNSENKTRACSKSWKRLREPPRKSNISLRRKKLASKPT